MITGYIGNVTPLRNTINVRQEPSTRATIVGTLRYGKSLCAVVVGNEWIRVEYGDDEAFVARHVVKLEMDT